MTELKQCPECGRKPAIIWKNGYSYVMCKRCRLSTGLIIDWEEPMDSKETAINYWNTMFRGEKSGNIK